jgi:hypothetical protein
VLATAVEIVVSHGGRSKRLGVGGSVTIGRSQVCDIRLADPLVSRRACLLRVEPTYVMVFNESTRTSLTVRPPVGEDRRVAPGSGVASLPYVTFDVVFAGADGRPVGVHVDARYLSAPEPPAVDPDDEQTCDIAAGGLTGGQIANLAGRRGARMQAALLTPAQRLALVALCEPMLTRNGSDARLPSTSELADRLRLRPGYVYNIIKEVRHRLADAGVPGLMSADGAASGRIDLRLTLARWAIEAGAVTVRDLAELPGLRSDLGSANGATTSPGSPETCCARSSTSASPLRQFLQ